MHRLIGKFGARLLAILVVCLAVPWLTHAQNAPSDNQQSGSAPALDPSDSSDPSVTLFPHSETSRYWVSGQANFIFQAHPDFPAAYSGPNSLHSFGEHALSRLLTLYLGVELTPTTEILFDEESTGGRGISDALGLGGFTDLDVVRNPELGSTPYVARVILHQIIPLSRDRMSVARGPLGLFTSVPVRRLEFRLGKMSLPDMFDLNSVGSDSHLQFMNWTADNNAAYDYAADTRGYTYAAVIEYDDRVWSARFAEALMPTVANGINLDWNVSRARSENIEFELRKNLLPRRAGVFRILSYINHADMGSYSQAIQAFLSGADPVPDITAHRRQGRIKYGFGGNFEQPLNDWATAFGRFGWNEGKNESFAYTEVDQTVQLGIGFAGKRWQRTSDRGGVTFISNAISRDHQRYLALGGLGFLLGDGGLDYGRENIVESYYTAHLWRGVFASFDLQHINDPGYNRARGPVIVPGLRLHLEF